MKSAIKYGLLSALFVCSPAFSLPFGIEVHQSKHGWLFAIKDAHPGGGCTKQEAEDLARAQIVEAARKLNAMVICEDMAHYQGNNRLFSKTIQQANAHALEVGDSSISFMMRDCTLQGVKCWNAEFRHFKTPSIYEDPSAKVGDVLAAMRGAALSMKAQNKDKPTNADVKEYVEKALEEFITDDNALMVLELEHYDKDKTIGDFLNDLRTGPETFDFEVDPDEEEEFLANVQQEIQLCDLKLFDGKVAQKLGELSQTEKVIILSMGSGHVKNLNPLFAKLGYVHRKDLSVENRPIITVGNDGPQIDASCCVDIKKFFSPFTIPSDSSFAKKAAEPTAASPAAAGAGAAAAAAGGGAGVKTVNASPTQTTTNSQMAALLAASLTELNNALQLRDRERKFNHQYRAPRRAPLAQLASAAAVAKPAKPGKKS